jgi:hypothetical protein
VSAEAQESRDCRASQRGLDVDAALATNDLGPRGRRQGSRPKPSSNTGTGARRRASRSSRHRRPLRSERRQSSLSSSSSSLASG